MGKLVFAREPVLDEGNVDVVAVLVVAAELEDEGADVAGDLLLGHGLHHLGHGHLHTLVTAL